MHKFLFILFFISVVSQSLQAKHIAGGDFYSTWVNGNNFRLTLKLYRDCTDPTGSPFDQSITIGIFSKSSNVLVSSFEVYLGTVVDLTLTGNLCSPPPDVCMQQGTYNIIVNLPNNSAGYYAVWERCCRNANIVNLNNPSQAAMAFYLEIPDPAIQNSSPVFQSDPLPYMCISQPWTYNFNVTDPSNTTRFVSDNSTGRRAYFISIAQSVFSRSSGGGGQTPLSGPYSLVSWASGYSQFNVVTGAPTLSINNATGQMQCTPLNQGMYAMAVVVEEYRNGILIGRVRREIEFYVISCNQNVLPTVTPSQTPVGGTTFEVYAGDTLALQLTIADPKDSLYIIHQGDPFPRWHRQHCLMHQQTILQY